MTEVYDVYAGDVMYRLHYGMVTIEQARELMALSPSALSACPVQPLRVVMHDD